MTLTLVRWPIDRTSSDQKETIEAFLTEYDFICTTIGTTVVDILREALPTELY